MLRGTVLVFLSRNVQKAAALLLNLVLARLLGERGVGVYGLLIWVPTYVTTLGTLGLGPAHVYLRGQQRITLRQSLGNSLAAAVLFGLLSVVLFQVVRPFLRLDTVDPLLMTLITLIFPIVILQSYLDYLWVGENRMGWYASLYSLRYVTLPLFVLLGLLLPANEHDRYIGMALGIVANSVVTAGVSLLAVHREYGLGMQLDTALFRRAARYGLSVQAGSVAQAIGYRFDVFLVNYFLGPAITGLYFAATNLAEAIWILPSAISAALLPRVSTRDVAAAQRVTAQTTRFVLAISVVTGLLLFVVAEPVLTLVYQPSFASATVALRILLIGTVVFSVQKVLANYLIGQGRAGWFQWVTLVSMAVNVAINLVLVPRHGWGIRGAATASAVSYTLSTAALAFLFLRSTGRPLRDLLLPNRRDVARLYSRLSSLRHRAPGAHKGVAP